jgi:hypothetical protein
MVPSEWSFLDRREQPNQAKLAARDYLDALVDANQMPSHGENRGLSPLGSARRDIGT